MFLCRFGYSTGQNFGDGFLSSPRGSPRVLCLCSASRMFQQSIWRSTGPAQSRRPRTSSLRQLRGRSFTLTSATFDRRRPPKVWGQIFKACFFSRYSLGRDVPVLPEREDGEGEESASYSNWNQPRK